MRDMAENKFWLWTILVSSGLWGLEASGALGWIPAIGNFINNTLAINLGGLIKVGTILGVLVIIALVMHFKK
mgnify:CR=1 FL=1